MGIGISYLLSSTDGRWYRIYI